MMKAVSLLLISIASCQMVAQETPSSLLGLHPTDQPVLLLSDILPSPLTEYNGTASADATDVFYTAELARKGVIMHVKWEDGHWQAPVVASFSGKYSEYDPVFNADGSRLYFCSRRPVIPDGKSGMAHIWYVEKDAQGSWTEPQLVPLTDNGDYYASEAVSGNLYFNQWNPGKLFCARPNASEDYDIIELDAINQAGEAGDPYVDPQEDFIIFRGYMKDRLGAGDLYISYRDGQTWTEPINLGEPINSSAHEMCPYLTPDGAYLIFASNRTSNYPNFQPGDSLTTVIQYQAGIQNGMQNIYYISADFVRDLDPRD